VTAKLLDYDQRDLGTLDVDDEGEALAVVVAQYKDPEIVHAVACGAFATAAAAEAWIAAQSPEDRARFRFAIARALVEPVAASDPRLGALGAELDRRRAERDRQRLSSYPSYSGSVVTVPLVASVPIAAGAPVVVGADGTCRIAVAGADGIAGTTEAVIGVAVGDARPRDDGQPGYVIEVRIAP